MTLQTSGAISLNDIHLELGASSGTTVSLNDADVRGLAGISSGAIDLADFYGASAGSSSTTTTTLTVTQSSANFSGINYYGEFINGSTSPTSVGSFGVRYIFRRHDSTQNTNQSDFWFYLNGTPAANFVSSIELNFSGGSSVTLNTSDAITAQSGTTYRYWTWDQDEFTTTQHFAFVSNWDGSGNVTLDVTHSS